MGDMGEIFRAHKRDQQARHAWCKEQNLAALRKSGIAFEERAEALLFRNPDAPKVDFFPSTGRWRIPGEKYTHSGGAGAFLRWYAKRRQA